MIYPRPKLTIFAEAAKTGEVIAYPDWARGWGITLEQTNSKPPMEWMNDALKQLNTHSLYLLQNGGYEWDKALEYPVGAKVQLNNLIYIAKAKNTNINPANNTATWQVYGLQQSDISQILDGTSKTKVASEDALRRVNLTAEKGVSDAKVAKDKADLVGIQANQNTQNLNDKVSKSGDTMSGSLSTPGLTVKKQAYPEINLNQDNGMGIVLGVNIAGDTYIKRPGGVETYVRAGKGGYAALTSELIGVNQSWRDFTGSRSSGTTYTNSTESPIMVSVSTGDTSGSKPRIQAYVSGVKIIDYVYDGGPSEIGGVATFIVPAGASYRVNMTDNGYITLWSELR